ncbi:hypothetical protein ACFL5M_02515 [Candidatus Neomarinimicrobiota bacterium]
MNSRGCPRIVGLLWLLVLSAVTIMAEDTGWYTGTAFTMPKGHWEKGLFQPLCYGKTDKLEWSTNLIFNPVLPNVRIKASHGRVQSWYLASRYNIHYPTPLLRLLQRPGTGGMIAPDPDIPEIPRILAFGGELIVTRKLFASVLLTGRFGARLAIRSGELDQRVLIELPIVFPRMMRYLHGYQIVGGASLLTGIGNTLDFRLDTDFFVIPGVDQPFAWEHKGMVRWRLGDRMRLLGGYELIYGEYPFRKQWHLIPLIDLQWTGQRK